MAEKTTTGNTPITAMRLPTETRDELDRIAEHHGLRDRTAAVVWLAKQAARKLPQVGAEKKSGK